MKRSLAWVCPTVALSLKGSNSPLTKPGSSSMSLSRNSRWLGENVSMASFAAAFRPPATPRLVSDRWTWTAGKADETAARVPSADPLSHSRIANGGPDWAARVARHSSAICLWLKVRTMTVIVGTVSDFAYVNRGFVSFARGQARGSIQSSRVTPAQLFFQNAW